MIFHLEAAQCQKYHKLCHWEFITPISMDFLWYRANWYSYCLPLFFVMDIFKRKHFKGGRGNVNVGCWEFVVGMLYVKHWKYSNLLLG